MSKLFPEDDVGRLSIFGGLTAIGLLLMLIVWAATMTVASAAHAPGRVAAEGNRKTVQHSEGGPVLEIYVREGQRVERGQPLLKLDLTITKAEVAVHTGALIQSLIRQARLRAELGGFVTFEIPAEIEAERNDSQVRAVIDQETSLYNARKAAYKGTVGLFEQQVAGSKQQIESLKGKLATSQEQFNLIKEEMDGIAPLVTKGYVPKTRQLALKRNAAALQGDVETTNGLIVAEENKILSTEIQMAQLEKDRTELIAKELSDIDARIADVRPRLIAAKERLARAVLVAPEDGYVYGMTVFGNSAAATPGQTLLEIVPVNDNLVLAVEINPGDIKDVAPGQKVIVHVLPYNRRRDRTVIMGSLKSVSADRFEATQKGDTGFYKGVVTVDTGELQRASVDLVPGMPVDTLINTGDRTIARYFLDPLYRVYDFALRER